MISLFISLLIIVLVFTYCNNLIEIIVAFSLIILFICLARDWTLQEFIKNFIEMFDPIKHLLEEASRIPKK